MISKKKITIIGGGVAAMMLASELDSDIFDIHIYEKGSGIGKKFLVAGKGGFNLTHSEPMESFVRRYEPLSFLRPFLQKFDNKDLRIWFENIGIPTMIGSSKKVYPVKGIKPVEVLNAIKGFMDKNNVIIHYKHKFIRIKPDGTPVFETEGKTKSISSDIVVFALGGASWSVTGSDGKWLNILKESGVLTKRFEPSNCAFEVDWDDDFITKNEGKPLKNIAAKTSEKYIRGELMITRFGLEGGAIYAMSGKLRKALNENNQTSILIDLKPEYSLDEIENRLKKSKDSITVTKALKQYLNIDKTKINLLKTYTSKEDFNNTKTLSYRIKNLRIEIIGIANIDEAISTVGGIRLDALDENLKLKALPYHYAIGEMLDWDAPTGGYLLQASFSMGYYLANYLNDKG